MKYSDDRGNDYLVQRLETVFKRCQSRLYYFVVTYSILAMCSLNILTLIILIIRRLYCNSETRYNVFSTEILLVGDRKRMSFNRAKLICITRYTQSSLKHETPAQPIISAILH